MFLQGLSTPVFYRLGRKLKREGAGVHRINICAGDTLFWLGKSTNFRARFTQWSRFVVDYLEQNAITDILLFGDCRPYHRVAIARARARGIAVHIFEEGVVRPHWITLETDASWRAPGQLTAVTLPALANALPPVPPHRSVAGGFAQRACWDVALHFCNIVFGLSFPHYQRHRPDHPLAEGMGWLRRARVKPRNRRAAEQTIDTLLTSRAPYFLLPLQLDSDAQIRFHSPFSNMGSVLDEVLASFAKFALPGDRLLVKAHPLDNGLINRAHQVASAAHRYHVSDRVDFIDGGHLPTIIEHSLGVVVVNSTVGLSALHQKRPTFALAHPLYDLPGLTAPGDLDAFWGAPQPPDATMLTSFEKVLMHATQINGSYFNLQGIELAVTTIAQRLQTVPAAQRGH